MECPFPNHNRALDVARIRIDHCGDPVHMSFVYNFGFPCNWSHRRYLRTEFLRIFAFDDDLYVYLVGPYSNPDSSPIRKQALFPGGGNHQSKAAGITAV